MSEQLLAAFLGAIVGGTISIASGWFLPKVQESRQRNEKRSLFAKALIVDLTESSILYQKIIDDFKKTNQIWYEHTIELKEYRKIYNRYPENVLLFSKILQDKIINYYIKTDKLIHLLEACQNRLLTLVNQYQNIYRAAKQNYPSFTDFQINQLALALTNYETTEAANINTAIKDALNQLEQYKRDALQIKEDINNQL